MSPPVIKVLFLSANPTDNNIRIDVEVRDIEERIKRGKYRDRLRFVPKFAARPHDIQDALLEVKPDIVHFSGHGDRLGSLIVEASKGQSSSKVKPSALASPFKTIKQISPVRCVLISACYSDEAIDALHQHVPFVIGMKDAVHYDAARTFEIGFYDALVDGQTIPFAFSWGCNSMEMHGFDGRVPVIRTDGADKGLLLSSFLEIGVSNSLSLTVSSLSKGEYKALQDKVHELIGKSQTEEALRIMIETLKNKNSNLVNGVLTLQQEFNRLKKLNMINAISYSEYSRELNRITMNLLEHLNDLTP